MASNWTSVSDFPVARLEKSFILSYERDFDARVGRQWMEQNWHKSFYYTAIYLLVIFGGQAYMKNRPKFELRGLLALWNSILAVFSIVGTYRTIPKMAERIRTYGFDNSVCFNGDSQVVDFWVWVFVLSKLPELGDTVFIVLRKQKLVFLHWYHHITVLYYCWYSYKEYFPPGEWFMDMNFFVHSLMYTYFALRAMKVTVPRWIAMFITSCQIAQMLLGGFICFWAYTTKIKGVPCQSSEGTAKLGLLMYSSYFVLFAKLFYESYIAPASRRRVAKFEKKID